MSKPPTHIMLPRDGASGGRTIFIDTIVRELAEALPDIGDAVALRLEYLATGEPLVLAPDEARALAGIVRRRTRGHKEQEVLDRLWRNYDDVLAGGGGEAWVFRARRAPRPFLTSKRDFTTIHIDQDLLARLDEQALRVGLARSEHIEDLLREASRKTPPGEAPKPQEPSLAALEHQRMTIDWHGKIRDGTYEEDTPESDLECDEMSDLWFANLTVADKRLACILSADLYCLGEGEARREALPGEPLDQRVNTAIGKEDWTVALDLLRHEGDITEPWRARCRARAWRHLGYIEAADVFLGHAVALEKADGTS